LPLLLALVPCFLGVPAGHAQAGSTTSGALFDELARMDSVLFDAAFVTCNYPRIDSILSADIEFYHDQNGFHGDTAVRSDFTRLTGNCPRGLGVTRELISGSLEVYPISDYGAIQMGEHRFIERGSPTYTIARFIHLWKRGPEGRWTLTRILSFDHQARQ
jgi:hypothetical protein